jgi:hypothetical protein
MVVRLLNVSQSIPGSKTDMNYYREPIFLKNYFIIFQLQLQKTFITDWY